MATATATAALDRNVSSFVSKTQKILINGKWVEAASGKTFATYNPATGDVLSLVAEGDREWLRMQRARGDDPLWILRNIDPDNELASPSGPLRDPESVTEDAGRDRAAAEIMRHSLEALFTLQEYGEYGTLLSTTGARRFYRELEGAALRHPTVVLALLYASRREHHGWVQ